MMRKLKQDFLLNILFILKLETEANSIQLLSASKLYGNQYLIVQ